MMEKTEPQSSPSILDRLDSLRRALFNLAVFAAAVVIVIAAVRVLINDRMSIDPVGMPKTILEMGYGNEAAALRLQDNIRAIAEQAQVQGAIFNVSARAEDFDLAVPVEGVSFTGLVRFLRQTLGWPQRRLTADFVCVQDPCALSNLELRMRTLDETGQSYLFPPISGGSPDQLLQRGAEAFVGRTHPMAVAVVLNLVPGRREDAWVYFDKVIASDDVGRPYALSLKSLGLVNVPQASAADLSQAEAWAKDAVASAPELGLPHVALAEAQKAQGRVDEAIASYRNAIARDASQSVAHYALGEIFLQRNDAEAAVAEYGAAAKSDPQDPDYHLSLGRALLSAGKMQEAEQSFSAALAISPNFAAAQYNLGVTQEALGKKGEAAEAFSNYLRLSPQADDAEAVRQRVRGLNQNQ